jgi:hypothetical protein
MTAKIYLFLLLNFYSFTFYAQNQQQTVADSVAFNTIDKRYKGGKKAFFTHLGTTLKCPQEARENCRFGIVLVTLKLRSSGVIDSILFKNDAPLGMGLEEEIAKVIFETKGQWTRAVEYTTIAFSVAFCEENDKPNATILVTLSGSQCPSNQDLIKDLEKAKKKKKYKEALSICEDLIRRFPNSEEYKKEWVSLKANLSQ